MGTRESLTTRDNQSSKIIHLHHPHCLELKKCRKLSETLYHHSTKMMALTVRFWMLRSKPRCHLKKDGKEQKWRLSILIECSSRSTINLIHLMSHTNYCLMIN